MTNSSVTSTLPNAQVPASTPTRSAPRPTLAPLPPTADFIAMLKTPIKPWLIDFSDADLKANLRSDLARRDVRGADMYAAELARRNTLRQMVAEYGYATVASMTGGAVAA